MKGSLTGNARQGKQFMDSRQFRMRPISSILMTELMVQTRAWKDEARNEEENKKGY